MSDVKRYEAVHLRYDDNNIRYGEGCEVEVVLASDYAALEAELARLRAGQEPVAAQVRFRRPEKGLADWSVWQQTSIKPHMPAWSIDGAGYEVEYRLLYTTPQPSAGVVMPERKQLPDLWFAEFHESRGWNACLDEFARLNKGAGSDE